MSQSKDESFRLTRSDFYSSHPSKVPLTLNEFEIETQNDAHECSSVEKRQSWGNRFEFLLACIGYSVGLGNVWRFGYLCAKSGGGSTLLKSFFKMKIFNFLISSLRRIFDSILYKSNHSCHPTDVIFIHFLN